ncbi:hypothetical protein [Xanthomonas oryzae]|uniref:hypothetical protein n=1 Tax=Xanthomonas oryzae TaxID=347 RepID=UPI0013966A46|nr:hypothetical protein [Xanthomonas oryzae]UWI58545.1 hypothetical protein NO430_10740 [Xanthomonas oryzae pv. oryzae]
MVVDTMPRHLLVCADQLPVSVTRHAHVRSLLRHRAANTGRAARSLHGERGTTSKDKSPSPSVKRERVRRRKKTLYAVS